MESYQFTYGNSQWRDRLTQVSFTNTSGVTKTETLSYGLFNEAVAGTIRIMP